MIVLKKEFADVVIGFKNSSKPLGLRSQAELVFLYEKAKEKNIQSWLNYFSFENEKEITEEEIEQIKVDEFIQKHPKSKRSKK